MSESLIVGIVAATAGLCATVLGWYLNQQGVFKQAKELEALKSRLDIITMLSKSEISSSELNNDIEHLKLREMRAVLSEIKSLTEVEKADTAPHEAKQNQWSRIFLAYDQISLKGRIYKGLFYAFTFFAVSVASMMVVVAEPNEWVFGLIGGLVYFFIGLSCRRAAIRNYNTEKKKQL